MTVQPVPLAPDRLRRRCDPAKLDLLSRGLEQHESQFGGAPWQPLFSLDAGEAAALALAALGLAWLVAFALLALRGRIRPALFSP